MYSVYNLVPRKDQSRPFSKYIKNIKFRIGKVHVFTFVENLAAGQAAGIPSSTMTQRVPGANVFSSAAAS